MKRICFHVDNFEKTDNNLYTLVCLKFNKLLGNQSVVFYDNDYGPLGKVFADNSLAQHKTTDINSQLNETHSRLIYKFEIVKPGEKSILYSVTEAPLVIHDPELVSHWKTSYSFTELDKKDFAGNSEDCQAFKTKLTEGLKNINSFGYVYDNKFIMILHGNRPAPSEESSSNSLASGGLNNDSIQNNDVFVNIIPNIVEDKISNMKRQLGVGETFQPNQIVSKGQKKTYKYKLSCNWMSTEQLYDTWKRMYSPGIIDLVHTTGEDYDFLVIVNRPNCEYRPEKSIVYRMEPYIETNKYYNDWNRHDKSQFMYFLEHSDFRNNTEWWIANAQATNIPKDKLLSAVISSQYDMVGHKFRVDFLKYFQGHSQYEVDTYGYSNKHDFKNYMGSLPEREKDTGLFPYKYTIAVENCDITNYFTEKLYDAIISECLCFYWGCNNVEEFIDPQAFIRLDGDDLQKSLQIVEDAIRNDEWSKRIDVIRREKKRILEHFNIFTRTSSLIYMKSHMKFFMSTEVPFVNNTQFSPSELDMSIGENVKTAEHILRNYDQSIIKIWEYSTLMSHHQLWKQCASDNQDYCIVQGTPNKNFVDHMCTALSEIASLKKDYDIYTLHENPSNGYIITPGGARKLLNLVNTYGMFTNLDNMLLSSELGIKIISSFKPLVSSNKFQSNLSLHLFKQIDGMLNNTPELFNQRTLKPDTENVMVVLDF